MIFKLWYYYVRRQTSCLCSQLRFYFCLALFDNNIKIRIMIIIYSYFNYAKQNGHAANFKTKIQTIISSLYFWGVKLFFKSMNLHFFLFISGISQVIQCKFRLPLKLICLPGQPSKTANHKLTIDTNKPPVSLLSLFPGRTFEVTCL